jgi:hypothetical protein
MTANEIGECLPMPGDFVYPIGCESLPGDKNFSREEKPYGYSMYFLWSLVNRNKLKNYCWDYEDRLQTQNPEKFEEAKTSINEIMENYSRKQTSEFLSIYTGKKCKAVALIDSCNLANGRPLKLFIYKILETKE